MIIILSIDKGKPGESLGRKAKGPIKWQPATERGVFYFTFIM